MPSGKTCSQLEGAQCRLVHLMALQDIYKYVFRAVGCFPGPYLAKRFNRSAHKLKQNSYELFRGGTSSSTGMAAVVIAIAHEPYQRKKHTH